MDRWVDFDVVTREALEATLSEFGVAPTTMAELDDVAAAFEGLDLADGAEEAVTALRQAGLSTGILTNASAPTLGRVADRLGLPMDHLLSVDAARHFKPHPAVYRLATEATGLSPERIGFVTANGWDAAGAAAFGLQVAWLRPGPAATVPAVGVPEPSTTTWQDVATAFR
jgi:2-haloacid dehalogenase